MREAKAGTEAEEQYLLTWSSWLVQLLFLYQPGPPARVGVCGGEWYPLVVGWGLPHQLLIQKRLHSCLQANLMEAFFSQLILACVKLTNEATSAPITSLFTAPTVAHGENSRNPSGTTHCPEVYVTSHCLQSPYKLNSILKYPPENILYMQETSL